ncbi:threonine synthase [Temperatibacter marinus]|uniref:Threonine synthase n=1 Tax=Temperatibacter marinus TaxID=1456591 RepID=A0AA52H9B6_9PROT|nr:threonine synthase [Temperatibacter marinus]WND01520.1 threonine synthase [Temperatibacter marinus]
MEKFKNYVTHLECGLTGQADYLPGEIHGLSQAGRPLLVRYALKAMKHELNKNDIWARPGGFWKWRELLPLMNTENLCALGETDTPLQPCPRLQKDLNVTGEILMKDEGRLPTGSFKARGLGVAVAMAKELGLKRLAMPTNGNAGAALAAYATKAGLESYIFAPDDTPDINIREISLQGGKVWRVNGLINDCGKIVFDGKEKMGWFDLSTLKEPYRIEGKKTMGLELAAQLGWSVPDAIFYPTGGGTGLIGMWKAFDELEKLGWIGSKRPKMFAVQATGCAPIVKAFNDGTKHADLWEDAHTYAAGIRVPVAVGDHLILEAVRESKGAALAVSDEDIEIARQQIGQREGFLVCPEGAATFAAYKRALKDGRIDGADQVVLFNCGNGLKYPMEEQAGVLDRRHPIDYDALK